MAKLLFEGKVNNFKIDSYIVSKIDLILNKISLKIAKIYTTCMQNIIIKMK